MLLGDFWARQRFSYLVTYSFQRGPELTALKKQLQQEAETARYMRRAALYQQIEALEQHSVTLTQGLSNVHPTATAMARLAAGSTEVQQLVLASQRSSKQEMHAMCLPIYRDAVAFYSEADKLVSVLNSCFEYLFMQTDRKEHVEADVATYDFIRNFLIQLGHPIENGSWA